MSQNKKAPKQAPTEEELRQAKIKALKKERAAQNAKTKKELLELGEQTTKNKTLSKKPTGQVAESSDVYDIDAKIKELSARLNAIKKEEKK